MTDAEENQSPIQVIEAVEPLLNIFDKKLLPDLIAPFDTFFLLPRTHLPKKCANCCYGYIQTPPTLDVRRDA
jgi:hypothetical protein